MPFTVSHAAAVLPFRKLNLVWSAFIIGSMAPDFPYVIGNAYYRSIGHHFPGVVEFTLPTSLIVLWFFHNVIKQPVVGLLPVGFQQRLRGEMGEFHFGGLRRFLRILASVALGVLTHIVWDSFTHSGRFAYRHMPWLRGSTHVPFVGVMPIPAALQYSSSILGLVVLAVWVWFWYKRTPVPDSVARSRPNSRFALAVTMVVAAGMIGLLRALIVVGMPAFRSNANHFLLVFGVTSLALAFWQLLFYCVLVSTHQMWTLN